MQQGSTVPQIDSAGLDQLLKSTLPTPSQQAENLILWLGDSLKDEAEAWKDVPAEEVQAIMGGRRPDSIDYIAQFLANQGILQSIPVVGREFFRLQMLFPGWNEYERLKHAVSSSRMAFMALQFNDPELDQMIASVFRPAVAATGFELKTLADDQPAGLIDDRLRVEIRRCKFMLADMTHRNPGAYWEAGFAEGLGKPVIYTCKRAAFDKGVSHFDTNHHLTVLWDDDIEAVAAKLKATIRATLPSDANMND
jgi:nucleoside 2-deoxyribosyltransferase